MPNATIEVHAGDCKAQKGTGGDKEREQPRGRQSIVSPPEDFILHNLVPLPYSSLIQQVWSEQVHAPGAVLGADRTAVTR